MTHIVVDPVTRIESHLRVEAEVDGGVVKEAWSSSTMFRGIESILRGRDPRDAWVFAQRSAAYTTSTPSPRSVPSRRRSARCRRPTRSCCATSLWRRRTFRIMFNSFLSAPRPRLGRHRQRAEWRSGQDRDACPQSISDWPLSSATSFSGLGHRIKAFVERGQLGIFANAYWGHPAYRLPPEANLMAVAHYLEALDWQRRFIKIHAILGGKNPHLQSFLVGGMATPVDPNSQNSLNMDTIAALDKLVADGLAFVSHVYLPDVLAIASYYKDWASIGAGIGNYMSYGEYPEDDSDDPRLFLPPGPHSRPGFDKDRDGRPGQDFRICGPFLVRLFSWRRQGT